MNDKNCEKSRAYISELETTQLLSGLDSAFEAHVSSCPDCQRYFEQTVAIATSLEGLVVAAPPELYPHLVGKLTHPIPWAPRRLVVLICLLIAMVSAAAYVWYDYYKTNFPASEPVSKGVCSPHEQQAQMQSTPSQSAQSRS